MGHLQAGVARTTITPPLGTYLIGYADRSSGCRSVHDDLTATALVLDDATHQLVIVTLDMLVLNERVVARVRTGIAERWRIPAEGVMICCSHTHSGPIAYADSRSKRKNRQFIDGLVEILVTTVGEASAGREPAVPAWGQGEVHIAINRRQLLPDGTVTIGTNAAGPVDRSLLVLQVRRKEDNHPLVTLANLACHATTLGPTSYVVSADWPGAMRRGVEAATGAPCMFLQGATGNQNPDHEWGQDDLAAMERIGGQVAEQVLNLLPGLQPLAPTPLLSRVETVWLPIVPQMKADGTRPRTYREVLAREAGVPRFMVDWILRARYPWQTARAQRDGRWYALMELQSFRFGDCALVAHAAEPFNEIGTAIKTGSPAPLTLFAGYSNGCIGYLPTAEAHALGGYEVELTPYIYRMPGILDPGCGALAIRHSLEMLESLWGQE